MTRWFRPAVLLVLLTGLTPPSARAQEEFSPNRHPSLAVKRAAGKITLDGDLGDPGWAGAARALNFTEITPRDNVRPDVETEAWVAYDADYLYVAFIARDDPRSIRSSLTDRDAIFQDDHVGVLLDPYGDGSLAYYLFANPRGIQGDIRYNATRGEDSRFDIIYRSEGKVTAEGYVVEMAIPFASLRFPDRPVQTWRASFIRNRPRASRAQMLWSAVVRGDPCLPCSFGTLTGIEGIKPGGAFELIPAAIATQAGALKDPTTPSFGFKNETIDGDLSLTGRYSFKSGLTAEATINPDFSQVESDASRVDVNTTFALSFPERRPFFQEGSDLFGTNINAVYTRNINDPIFAAKLVQRTGRTSLGFLVARDEHSPILLPFQERSFTAQGGQSSSGILRGRRTFGRNSYVGGLLTERRLDGGGGGSVASVDGTIAISPKYQFEFQFLGSRTREPFHPALTAGVDTLTFDGGKHTARFDGETFEGYAQYSSFERSGRHWSFDFDYYASSPTFRAENGFETRNDSRRVSMIQTYVFFPNSRLVERVQPRAYVFRNWSYGGTRKSQGAELGLNLQLTGQTYLAVEYNTGDERFKNLEFPGLDQWAVGIESAFSEAVQLEVGWEHGERIARNVATPIVGRGTDLDISATIRPAGWIAIRPSYVHSDLSAGGQTIFSGYLLRNRADLQFTRALFLRLVVDYDGFDRTLSIEPLLTYRANPFTLMYLGSSRGYQEYEGPTGWTRTETQYFAKVQYLWRK